MPREYKHDTGWKGIFTFTLPDNVIIKNAPAQSSDIVCNPVIFSQLTNNMKRDIVLLDAITKKNQRDFEIVKIIQSTTTNGDVFYTFTLKDSAMSFVAYKSPPKPGSSASINSTLKPIKIPANALQIFDGVDNELLEFCRKIDAALDEEKEITLLGKYHHVIPQNKDAVTHNKTEDSDKRKQFIRPQDHHEFNMFYLMLTNTLFKLVEKDIESIVDEKPSPNAKELITCINTLNEFGFYNVNGRPLNFWSGKRAQEKANHDPTSLSDSNIPAITIMMELANILQSKIEYIPQSHPVFIKITKIKTLLCAASSAVFAANASGDVICYYDSGLNKEEKFVMTAHNFHWTTEIGKLLCKLKQKPEDGGISSLNVSFYNLDTGDWDQSIPFEQAKHKINLARRGSYPNLQNNPALHERHPSRYDFNMNNDRSRDLLPYDKLEKFAFKLGSPIFGRRASQTAPSNNIQINNVANDLQTTSGVSTPKHEG